MRILIVDDQMLIRRGISMLLGTEEGIEVVGEASDGNEALSAVETLRPDVVLSDAQMPVMGGVQLIAELRLTHPDLPVIILTTFDDGDLVRRAIAAGAAGFLLKDSSTEDIVRALRAVIDGGLAIDPRVARAALTRPSAEGASAAAIPSPIAVLTRAERAVATEVATGATNGEIAQTLVIAEGTVKNHVSALLRKLNQRDRTALALLLARYLEPPTDSPHPQTDR